MLKPLWTPTKHRIENSQMHKFMQWLSREHDLNFTDYESLWQWSVDDLLIKFFAMLVLIILPSGSLQKIPLCKSFLGLN